MIKEYNGEITGKEIDEFENKYSVVLPEDYRSFLSLHNGAVAEQDTRIEIPGVQNYICADSLFGINQSRKWLDIEFWMDRYAGELPPGSVIIGRAVDDGFFVLITLTEAYGIYYWDSARNIPESTDESNAYYIADTFGAFEKIITEKEN